MPRFETILFDLDGTLTDPRIAITTSLAHALREVGVTYGYASRGELEAAGADALCPSPQALPDLLL